VVSIPSAPGVVVYSGAGCGLCESALAVVREICGDEFETVEIDGDEALEARYRDSLPVVEIDGERAFTYFVSPDALRLRLEPS
jgi:glutaredoxin